jgi:hypothetical protein
MRQVSLPADSFVLARLSGGRDEVNVQNDDSDSPLGRMRCELTRVGTELRLLKEDVGRK